MISSHRVRPWVGVALCLAGWTGLTAAEIASHPPMRPLPSRSQRPLADGVHRFVDPQRGDDTGPGTRDRPYQTVAHALEQLQPGDTLCLRGGVYFERVVCRAVGTAEKPITVRSCPGELAILDGGLPDFQLRPETAWEPAPGGVAGEYRSTRPYPELAGSAGGVNVTGSFADSMVPLHGYRFAQDLRSTNIYWNLENKVGMDEAGIYCGPGLWLDPATHRIHVRLAPTQMPYLPPEENYRGQTDPRKLPLVVAGGPQGPLALRGARHLRLYDLALRGARGATLDIADCRNVELDGLTVYGGYTPVAVRDTVGLRMRNTACRGAAAPWTYRGSLKYRSFESRLFSASGWTPTGADHGEFEIAYCEFTDSVDGVFLGNVRRVRFHHNLVDDVSDDGVFLTAGTGYDGETPGGDVHIYQNLFRRCLTTFAFGVGHGRQKSLPDRIQTGQGVAIYRNVIDLRRPVKYHLPGSAEQVAAAIAYGRIVGDHGGPTWEPIDFYHNTVLAQQYDRPAEYACGLAGHLHGSTRRRVFNNLFVQHAGTPGRGLPQLAVAKAPESKPADDPLDALLDKAPQPDDPKPLKLLDAPKDAAQPPPRTLPKFHLDFQADGNLQWSYAGTVGPDWLAAFRNSPQFAASQKLYPPGWTAHDVLADPRLTDPQPDWRQPPNVCLQADSPAINTGIALPGQWPDPLREEDGKPDLGALPRGAQPWPVGVFGRLACSGQPLEPQTVPDDWHLDTFPVADEATAPAGRAAIIEGYPAFDAPLVRYALRKHGFQVDGFPQRWLPPQQYMDYRVVVLVGDLARAKIEPRSYAADDVPHLRRFLQGGGTLWLLQRGRQAFDGAEARSLLAELAGTTAPRTDQPVRPLLPKHPWVNHLRPESGGSWYNVPGEFRLPVGHGERILGTADGAAVLWRLKVGDGQLCYVGWSTAAALPAGRAGAASLEAEALYHEQMQVLMKIAASLAAKNEK